VGYGRALKWPKSKGKVIGFVLIVTK